ncbi:MAG TPA: ATP-dependent zinc metalloprotease FtsH [Solirubrobacteraceae bacterium]|jgi:cell division protease FtsH|nr:ATP-dependent zinc metalloprotease FtsH [Solirubrobacteraceae bacterium]
MTDDSNPTATPSNNGAPSGDATPPPMKAVRSGLAHRRNPALAALGEFAGGARRVLLRDPLSLFLLLASIGLAIVFVTLLGAIKPASSGQQVPLSAVQALARRHDIATAEVLDHDSRVELVTIANGPTVSGDGTITPSAAEAQAAARAAAAAAAAARRAKHHAKQSSASATTAGVGTGGTAGEGTQPTGEPTASSTGSTGAAAASTGAAGATAATTPAELAAAARAGAGSQRLWSAYPASGAITQQLLKELSGSGASVTVNQQSGKGTEAIVVQFLIPILLLVCLFSLFMRQGAEGAAGGLAAFSEFAGKGRKKGKGTRDKITFADVAGAGEALAELREIRDYLSDPSKYLEVGAAAPKGVLLVGPPGTGKTLLAKAVAGEADAAFFSVSGSDFVESLVGVGAARVRDLFRKARKVSPAIIFIDELDAAGRKRGAGIGQGNDEREQTLNQILVEMDGFAGDGGLVVMGATNRPDILDPALLRPGRFDRQVVVDNPDVHGRLEILRLHGGKRPLAPDASLEEVARQTPGFSGAELANVINEAALLSVRDGRAQIDQATLEEAIDRVVAGPAKRHILTENERWLISIHESAHAVVTEALGHTTSTRKLSIVARGRQLGTAAHMLTDRDQLIMSESDLQAQLIVTVAGIAGERIAFGQSSTSVNDDLHAATNLARSMVTSFGMSEALGLVTIGEKGGEVFLGASLQDLGSVGPETLNLIDNEVERLVGDAEARANAILDRNWSAVEETATALLEHETLSGVALDAVLSTVQETTLEELAQVRRAAPPRFTTRDPGPPK